MLTLCLDTATPMGVVAVADGPKLLSFVQWRSESRHGEDMFAHIDSALDKAGIERGRLKRIGVDIGPGRFTGVRVGLSTAKGLALGLGLPIVGVHSLRVLAEGMDPVDPVPDAIRIPLMNAYRGEIFAAAYGSTAGSGAPLVEPFFGPPAEALRTLRDELGDRPVAVVGDGARKHIDLLREIFAKVTESAEVCDTPIPQALVKEVDRLWSECGAADLATLEPHYLKPSDAQLPATSGR
jgi:tRNA threonylcarbamoyladenosine biosynthesis protein TsaB